MPKSALTVLATLEHISMRAASDISAPAEMMKVWTW